ncbi:uncharacterized protein [Antedon mediterranea]|uniref:uncharacterized protein isoform X6 n=1 Tax=Antedon mediterranea TaxID=105859 RepID=UPI003AF58039
MKPSYLEAEVKDMPELKEEATGEQPNINDDDEAAKKYQDKPGLTDGNASFLRAARAGNLEKVFDYLKGSTDINTSNANGLNALHLSSKEGHLNIVTELLKRGADVDAATKKGNTALHIASLAGQFGIVKVLVNYSANVNIQSQNGFTPLYMAAQENHVDVVQFLLKNGANQNLATEDGFRPLDVATQQGHHVIVALLLECQHSKPTPMPQPQQQISQSESEDGFTPLAVALQQGHDKVVAVLLENDRAGKTRLPALHIAARKDDSKAAALLLQNKHDPDVTSKSGFTPLHIASHYGHVNVAILLIQKGATIDYAAKNNITPLHVASKWGRVNMINTLLDRGAKIDAKTRDGLTPLHCAARSGHDQSVDQLIERGAPVTAKTKNGLAPLHMAAQGDHVDSARLLLFHKSPVDDVTVDYLTPLHVAAHCGHHKVAKLLLDRKANPDARALNGFTPLHIACKKNRIKVIELLLKYGASIQSTTDSGLTPLHVAAFMGNVGNTLFLLKHGAIIDEPNVRGETPLHLAARANQIEIMRILLNSKAVVDARAHENQTPLHIAARLGNVEVVTLLLEQGANPDSQTKDLYTALHIAAREGKKDVAAALLEHGASLSKKTKKEFTPLHVAAKYGRLGVASLLLRHCASPDAKAQNDLTPLHIAAHYDHVDVAMLLLDQKASPISVAKNGFTPLHIAAKKNQIEIATTLLEYNADPNAVTKHGISPIHLAAQEGHTDMLSLLLEKGARPAITAKNGLTPLHLAAQEDKVNCASILVKNGSEIDPKTKAGYTPLHVACHYGNIKTATFLLRKGADIKSKTKHGNTPLHQAAQQGHVGVINQLLENGADPNETANNGYTPLGVAKRLGYISVINTLTTVTTRTETTTITTTTTEEKFKVQCPEIMVVNFMSEDEDEEEESGDDISMTGDHGTLTADEIRTLGDDSIVRDNRYLEQDWLGMDPDMKYYSGAGSLSGHYRKSYTPSRASTLGRNEDSLIGQDIMEGEVVTSTSQHVAHSAAPMSFSTPNNRNVILSPDDACPSFNGSDGRSTPHVSNHSSMQSGFLISFMVDARGGTLSSCRMPGMRVVVPPNKATGPTRVTCRLVKHSKLITPPPVMESEALASRVIEVGPSGAQFLGGLGNKQLTYPPLSDGESLVSRILEMGPVCEKFLGPVLLEVPHFASLRNGEREIVVLRSDTGDTWKEHSLNSTEEEVAKALDGYKGDDNNIGNERVCRILTKDFPQYFAIISRIHQETNSIGTNGGELKSAVEPNVTASFPMGTLTKKIKVGLQVQPVPHEVVKKVLGNRVMVSPIVTIEPRRRKFHKPITVTIPVPTAYNQGMINGYGSDSPTLRLLCSITGGTAPAQWEDITGSTPLSFSQDCCVSFTTTVSARFWLMDCKEIDQASTFSRELYQELRSVPFLSRFAIFAKTHDPIESRVRVFCSTDDRIDRGHFENQEHFTEVARSKEVEILEGRPVYIELAGNLLSVQKSGDQLSMPFLAFQDNRLTFFVRVRDQSQEACGRLSFMREPKVTKGMPPQKAVCNLNVTMPEYVKEYRMEKGERELFEEKERLGVLSQRNIYTITQVDESDEFLNQDASAQNLNFASITVRKKYTFLQDPVMSPTSAHMRAELRLMDIARQIGTDWQRLGRELKILEKDLHTIENENDVISEQAFVMLHTWSEKAGPDATSERLEAALQAIGHGEIAEECLGDLLSLDVTIEQEEEKEKSSPGEEVETSNFEMENNIGHDDMPGDENTEMDLNRAAALSKDTELKLHPDDVVAQHGFETQDDVYTDHDMQEALADPYLREHLDEIDEMTPAEIYEEIKEEIWEKHEEERQEMVFEPEFETVVEAQEEEIIETEKQEQQQQQAPELVFAKKDQEFSKTQMVRSEKVEDFPSKAESDPSITRRHDQDLALDLPSPGEEKAAQEYRSPVEKDSFKESVKSVDYSQELKREDVTHEYSHSITQSASSDDFAQDVSEKFEKEGKEMLTEKAGEKRVQIEIGNESVTGEKPTFKSDYSESAWSVDYSEDTTVSSSREEKTLSIVSSELQSPDVHSVSTVGDVEEQSTLEDVEDIPQFESEENTENQRINVVEQDSTSPLMQNRVLQKGQEIEEDVITVKQQSVDESISAHFQARPTPLSSPEEDSSSTKVSVPLQSEPSEILPYEKKTYAESLSRPEHLEKHKSKELESIEVYTQRTSEVIPSQSDDETLVAETKNLEHVANVHDQVSDYQSLVETASDLLSPNLEEHTIPTKTSHKSEIEKSHKTFGESVKPQTKPTTKSPLMNLRTRHIVEEEVVIPRQGSIDENINSEFGARPMALSSPEEDESDFKNYLEENQPKSEDDLNGTEKQLSEGEERIDGEASIISDTPTDGFMEIEVASSTSTKVIDSEIKDYYTGTDEGMKNEREDVPLKEFEPDMITRDDIQASTKINFIDKRISTDKKEHSETSIVRSDFQAVSDFRYDSDERISTQTIDNSEISVTEQTNESVISSVVVFEKRKKTVKELIDHIEVGLASTSPSKQRTVKSTEVQQSHASVKLFKETNLGKTEQGFTESSDSKKYLPEETEIVDEQLISSLSQAEDKLPNFDLDQYPESVKSDNAVYEKEIPLTSGTKETSQIVSEEKRGNLSDKIKMYESKSTKIQLPKSDPKVSVGNVVVDEKHEIKILEREIEDVADNEKELKSTTEDANVDHVTVKRHVVVIEQVVESERKNITDEKEIEVTTEDTYVDQDVTVQKEAVFIEQVVESERENITDEKETEATTEVTYVDQEVTVEQKVLVIEHQVVESERENITDKIEIEATTENTYVDQDVTVEKKVVVIEQQVVESERENITDEKEIEASTEDTYVNQDVKVEQKAVVFEQQVVESERENITDEKETEATTEVTYVDQEVTVEKKVVVIEQQVVESERENIKDEKEIEATTEDTYVDQDVTVEQEAVVLEQQVVESERQNITDEKETEATTEVKYVDQKVTVEKKVVVIEQVVESEGENITDEKETETRTEDTYVDWDVTVEKEAVVIEKVVESEGENITDVKEIEASTEVTYVDQEVTVEQKVVVIEQQVVESERENIKDEKEVESTTEGTYVDQDVTVEKKVVVIEQQVVESERENITDEKEIEATTEDTYVDQDVTVEQEAVVIEQQVVESERENITDEKETEATTEVTYVDQKVTIEKKVVVIEQVVESEGENITDEKEIEITTEDTYVDRDVKVEKEAVVIEKVFESERENITDEKEIEATTEKAYVDQDVTVEKELVVIEQQVVESERENITDKIETEATTEDVYVNQDVTVEREVVVIGQQVVESERENITDEKEIIATTEDTYVNQDLTVEKEVLVLEQQVVESERENITDEKEVEATTEEAYVDQDVTVEKEVVVIEQQVVESERENIKDEKEIEATTEDTYVGQDVTVEKEVEVIKQQVVESERDNITDKIEIDATTEDTYVDQDVTVEKEVVVIEQVVESERENITDKIEIEATTENTYVDQDVTVEKKVVVIEQQVVESERENITDKKEIEASTEDTYVDQDVTVEQEAVVLEKVVESEGENVTDEKEIEATTEKAYVNQDVTVEKEVVVVEQQVVESERENITDKIETEATTEDVYVNQDVTVEKEVVVIGQQVVESERENITDEKEIVATTEDTYVNQDLTVEKEVLVLEQQVVDSERENITDEKEVEATTEEAYVDQDVTVEKEVVVIEQQVLESERENITDKIEIEATTENTYVDQDVTVEKKVVVIEQQVVESERENITDEKEIEASTEDTYVDQDVTVEQEAVVLEEVVESEGENVTDEKEIEATTEKAYVDQDVTVEKEVVVIEQQVVESERENITDKIETEATTEDVYVNQDVTVEKEVVVIGQQVVESERENITDEKEIVATTEDTYVNQDLTVEKEVLVLEQQVVDSERENITDEKEVEATTEEAYVDQDVTVEKEVVVIEQQVVESERKNIKDEKEIEATTEDTYVDQDVTVEKKVVVIEQVVESERESIKDEKETETTTEDTYVDHDVTVEKEVVVIKQQVVESERDNITDKIEIEATTEDTYVDQDVTVEKEVVVIEQVVESERENIKDEKETETTTEDTYVDHDVTVEKEVVVIEQQVVESERDNITDKIEIEATIENTYVDQDVTVEKEVEVIEPQVVESESENITDEKETEATTEVTYVDQDVTIENEVVVIEQQVVESEGENITDEKEVEATTEYTYVDQDVTVEKEVVVLEQQVVESERENITDEKEVEATTEDTYVDQDVAVEKEVEVFEQKVDQSERDNITDKIEIEATTEDTYVDQYVTVEKEVVVIEQQLVESEEENITDEKETEATIENTYVDQDVTVEKEVESESPDITDDKEVKVTDEDANVDNNVIIEKEVEVVAIEKISCEEEIDDVNVEDRYENEKCYYPESIEIDDISIEKSDNVVTVESISEHEEEQYSLPIDNEIDLYQQSTEDNVDDNEVRLNDTQYPETDEIDSFTEQVAVALPVHQEDMASSEIYHCPESDVYEEGTEKVHTDVAEEEYLVEENQYHDSIDFGEEAIEKEADTSPVDMNIVEPQKEYYPESDEVVNLTEEKDIDRTDFEGHVDSTLLINEDVVALEEQHYPEYIEVDNVSFEEEIAVVPVEVEEVDSSEQVHYSESDEMYDTSIVNEVDASFDENVVSGRQHCPEADEVDNSCIDNTSEDKNIIESVKDVRFEESVIEKEEGEFINERLDVGMVDENIDKEHESESETVCNEVKEERFEGDEAEKEMVTESFIEVVSRQDDDLPNLELEQYPDSVQEGDSIDIVEDYCKEQQMEDIARQNNTSEEIAQERSAIISDFAKCMNSSPEYGDSESQLDNSDAGAVEEEVVETITEEKLETVKSMQLDNDDQVDSTFHSDALVNLSAVMDEQYVDEKDLIVEYPSSEGDDISLDHELTDEIIAPPEVEVTDELPNLDIDQHPSHVDSDDESSEHEFVDEVISAPRVEIDAELPNLDINQEPDRVQSIDIGESGDDDVVVHIQKLSDEEVNIQADTDMFKQSSESHSDKVIQETYMSGVELTHETHDSNIEITQEHCTSEILLKKESQTSEVKLMQTQESHTSKILLIQESHTSEHTQESHTSEIQLIQESHSSEHTQESHTSEIQLTQDSHTSELTQETKSFQQNIVITEHDSSTFSSVSEHVITSSSSEIDGESENASVHQIHSTDSIGTLMKESVKIVSGETMSFNSAGSSNEDTEKDTSSFEKASEAHTDIDGSQGEVSGSFSDQFDVSDEISVAVDNFSERLIEEIFNDAKQDYVAMKESQIPIQNLDEIKTEVEEQWHDLKTYDQEEKDTYENYQDATQDPQPVDEEERPRTPEITELIDNNANQNTFLNLESQREYEVYQPPTPVEGIPSQELDENIDVQTSYSALSKEKLAIVEGAYYVSLLEDETPKSTSDNDEEDESFRTCPSTLGVSADVVGTQKVAILSDEGYHKPQPEEDSLADITSMMPDDNDDEDDEYVVDELEYDEVSKVQTSDYQEEQQPGELIVGGVSIAQSSKNAQVEEEETSIDDLNIENMVQPLDETSVDQVTKYPESPESRAPCEDLICIDQATAETQPSAEDPLSDVEKELNEEIVLGSTKVLEDELQYEQEKTVESNNDTSYVELAQDVEIKSGPEHEEEVQDQQYDPAFIEDSSQLLKKEVVRELPEDLSPTTDLQIAETKVEQTSDETHLSNVIEQISDEYTPVPPVDLEIPEERSRSLQDPETPEMAELPDTPETFGDSSNTEGESPVVLMGNWPRISENQTQQLLEQQTILEPTETVAIVAETSESVEKEVLNGPTEQNYYDQSLSGTSENEAGESEVYAEDAEPTSSEQEAQIVDDEQDIAANATESLEVETEECAEILEPTLSEQEAQIVDDEQDIAANATESLEVETEECAEDVEPTSSEEEAQIVDDEQDIAANATESLEVETEECAEDIELTSSEQEAQIVDDEQDKADNATESLEVQTEEYAEDLEPTLSEQEAQIFDDEQDKADNATESLEVQTEEYAEDLEPTLSEQEAQIVDDEQDKADYATEYLEVDIPEDHVDNIDSHNLPELPSPVSTTDNDNLDEQKDEADSTHHNFQVRLTSEDLTTACAFTNNKCMTTAYEDSGETRLTEDILQSDSSGFVTSTFTERTTETKMEQSTSTSGTQGELHETYSNIEQRDFHEETWHTSTEANTIQSSITSLTVVGETSSFTARDIVTTTESDDITADTVESLKEERETLDQSYITASAQQTVETQSDETTHSREFESGTETDSATGGSEQISSEISDPIPTRDLTHVRKKHRDLHAYNECEGRISSFYSFNTVSPTLKNEKTSRKSKSTSSASLKRAVSLQETSKHSSTTKSKESRKVYKRSVSERESTSSSALHVQESFESEPKVDDIYAELHGVSEYVGEVIQPIQLFSSSCFLLLNSSYEPVDEVLNLNVNLGPSQEKHVITEDEIEQLTNVMNEIAQSEENALISSDNEMENGGETVNEDDLVSDKAQQNIQVNLNQLSLDEEADMDDLLNMDFSQFADETGDNKTVLERMSENEIAEGMAAYVADIPSCPTPQSNNTTVLNPIIQAETNDEIEDVQLTESEQDAIFQFQLQYSVDEDNVSLSDSNPDVHCAPPSDTPPSFDQEDPEKPYMNGHDNMNEAPMTPEIKVTNHDEAFIYAETKEEDESVPFGNDESQPVAEEGGQEPAVQAQGVNVVHSAPPSQPDDDDTTETVERFEETLPDGSIRIVTRRRVVRKVTQHVEVEGEPVLVDGDGQRNIVIQRKVTNRTVIVDGEEVNQSQDIQTNIVEDGEEVTDAKELRGDLQQIVDNFLQDDVILDDNQNEA